MFIEDKHGAWIDTNTKKIYYVVSHHDWLIKHLTELGYDGDLNNFEPLMFGSRGELSDIYSFIFKKNYLRLIVDGDFHGICGTRTSIIKGFTLYADQFLKGVHTLMVDELTDNAKTIIDGYIYNIPTQRYFFIQKYISSALKQR